MPWGVAAAVGAAVVGSTISASGAQSAAKDQENAANNATAAQTAQYATDQQNFSPYLQSGVAANNVLQNQLGIANSGTGDFSQGSLLSGPSLSQAQLETTPGYQFNLNQGMQGVQNSAAARGLGSSGNALAGAAQYATGLADSTYQNQFNNAVTNQTNQYNRLMGLTQLGQNSAAGVGAQGVQVAANIGSNIIGAGNAAAAGQIGSSNALSNGLNSAGYYGNNAFNGMYGNNGTSSTDQLYASLPNNDNGVGDF